MLSRYTLMVVSRITCQGKSRKHELRISKLGSTNKNYWILADVFCNLQMSNVNILMVSFNNFYLKSHIGDKWHK